MEPNPPKHLICIIGNDGSGKTTVTSHLNKQNILCIERSSRELTDGALELQQQIKRIDQLTFAYGFQPDRYNFDPATFIQHQSEQYNVCWVFLSCDVDVLLNRLKSRVHFTKYEHEKCVRYFNHIYEQLAYFYGMHIVNANQTIEQVIADVINCTKKPNPPIKMKNLTLNDLLANDIQTQLSQVVSETFLLAVYQQYVLPQIKHSGMHELYLPELEEFPAAKLHMAVRWIKNNFTPLFTSPSQVQLHHHNSQTIHLTLPNNFYLQKTTEGQSKILFKVHSQQPSYHNTALILLKNTIYSHKKQTTGEISELGKVRAKGSMIFLQMLRRNKLNHAYICVNQHGIILSRLVKTNQVEVVFKKELIGTDKVSYHHLEEEEKIVHKGDYVGGLYVRFDWRNPNQTLKKYPHLRINTDPYYYVVQRVMGKENFFKQILSEEASKCVALGDKCISEDLLTPIIQPKQIKQFIIQIYCCFAYYAERVGLNIIDGCFMFDESASTVWSQINPDCMRVKASTDRADYDKDIWRVGGGKEQILQKWNKFNSLYMDYFHSHRFMETQLTNQLYCKQIQAEQLMKGVRPGYQHFYRAVVRGKRRRDCIGTIDIMHGQPILVKESVFAQTHSSADIQAAWKFISIMPNVVVVDIDGACSNPYDNTSVINSLLQQPNNNIYAVGGGLRTLPKIQDCLKKAGKAIISSSLQLLPQLSAQQRANIIVQLSLNEKNQILTHGRTHNTHMDVCDKMVQLCEMGIKVISMTFVRGQGKLSGVPRQQLSHIMMHVPGPIEQVIIAGGIASVEDLEFVWGFGKCVPQLGSAIWKGNISIGNIYQRMVRYDQNGLVGCVVKTVHNKVLGFVYMNAEAIELTCQTRLLYRYSRQHKQILLKGATSNNTQYVHSMNIDCDNDSLLITVGDQHPFCHTSKKSCFFNGHIENQQKSLQALQEHILKKKQTGSGYSAKMQNSPQLAMMKIVEEIDQLALAENADRKKEEAADVLAHLLMYFNAQDIKLSDVVGVLNQRSRTKTISHSGKAKQNPEVKIGVPVTKHSTFVYHFLHKFMGVQMKPLKERSFQFDFTIVQAQKLQTIFGYQPKLTFINTKPKDMMKLLNKGIIDYGLNYSSVMGCLGNKYHCLGRQEVAGLKLTLVKRKGQEIKPSDWNQQNKGKIASQYPTQVCAYFTKMGISSSHFTIVRISGQSEGYLNSEEFHYCDAIVQTGQTISANNLQIQAILDDNLELILFKL